MSHVFHCGIITITTPDSWLDVTEDIGREALFTLAKGESGVGALQFSAAEYSGGKLPHISLKHLVDLLTDFKTSRELGSGSEHVESDGEIKIAGESFFDDGNFIRVWYCTDGRNVALITYVCEKGLEEDECADCESIVRNIGFKRSDI